MEEKKEPKINKKKIIIIVSILAGVVLIGASVFLVVRFINGGKQIAKEIDKLSENVPVIDLDDKLGEIVSNVSAEEEATTKEAETEVVEETEAVTEAATGEAGEEQSEAETEAVIDYANVDWWGVLEQVMLAGNTEELDWEAITNVLLYTDSPDESQIEILMNEIKKADNYDSIDWSAKADFSVGVVTETYTEPVTENIITSAGSSQKVTLEDMLLIDKNASSTGDYRLGNTWFNRSTIMDDVMPVKNQWIKDNFGTSFTFNGINFRWDETAQYFYWEKLYGSIHYMTSTTTSIEGYYIDNFYSYRIADYLGFYGTDYEMYMNEEALNDKIYLAIGAWQAPKMTVENPKENNLTYLRQLGWTDVVEEEGIDKLWTYESPEGVPAYVNEDGHLGIYVKYPGDEKESLCYFTIEEYNNLINNNTWTVYSKSGYSGLEGQAIEDMQQYIKKYVCIS